MFAKIGRSVKTIQSWVTRGDSPVSALVGKAETSARDALLKHAPIWLWKYREWRGDGVLEEELQYLPVLADIAKSAVDIGASEGWYTYHLLRCSKQVYAFEPQPALAGRLAYELRTERVHVEQVALSDHLGTAVLRVPIGVHQRGTIEAENPLEDAGEARAFEVVLRPLDSFELQDVGFMKIDVEGHELAVLRGAQKTIERCRPVLLVEVEERHKAGAVSAVREFLGHFGYHGFFFLEKRLVGIETFDASEHQDPRNLDGARKLGVYANNFIYVRDEHFRRIAHLR
jgi:FkbM family methyltransferase